MNKYRFVISYDGTDYYGWQFQPTKPTIVGALAKAYLNVFGEKITIQGCSRTDAGVHALGQIGTFWSAVSVSPERMMSAWNNLLPSSIIIRDITLVPNSFHLHKNINFKQYYYYFFLDRPLPTVARFGWHHHKKVDIHKLALGLQVFVGTHDFRSFATGDDRESTIRTIDRIDLIYIPELCAYRISIKGPKFLHYMIRRIVGAALYVASLEKYSINDLVTALEQKDSRQQLPKAPAHGLVLRRIIYAQPGDLRYTE